MPMRFNGVYVSQQLPTLNRAVLVLLLFMALSCTSEKSVESIDYPLEKLEFVFEGPLFQGANEAQVQVAFNPEQVLQEAGFTKDNVRGIRLKSMQLTAQDSSAFDVFESISVQFAGGESEMKTVASLPSVKKGQGTVQLTPVSDVSYEGVQNKPSFYVVVDANLKTDVEDNLMIRGDLVLSIDVK